MQQIFFIFIEVAQHADGMPNRSWKPEEWGIDVVLWKGAKEEISRCVAW